MEISSFAILLFMLVCHSTIRADSVARSEFVGDEKIDATLIVLIVCGVIVAIQIFVFLLLSCRAYDAIFGSRSMRTSDPESTSGNQFPFLPSYELAIQDTRFPQGNCEASTLNTSMEDQRTSPNSETNNLGVPTRTSSWSIGDGVVIDMRSLTAT